MVNPRLSDPAYPGMHRGSLPDFGIPVIDDYSSTAVICIMLASITSFV